MDIVLGGIHGIKGKIDYLRKSPFANDMMGEIATLVMMLIKDRTIAGKDVQGTAFKAYSANYEKWRKKKGYQTDHPDLTISGHMLSAMTEDHNKKEAKIFFMATQDSESKSAPDKAFWNQQSREFFGLSPDDEQKIMKVVTDYYEKATGRRTLK